MHSWPARLAEVFTRLRHDHHIYANQSNIGDLALSPGDQSPARSARFRDISVTSRLFRHAGRWQTAGGFIIIGGGGFLWITSCFLGGFRPMRPESRLYLGAATAI